MTNVLDFNAALTQEQLEERLRRGTVDADDIRARLHSRSREFVKWLFAGRAYCTRKEARIGSVSGEAGGSLSIAISGPGEGLWHDHATNEGGDLISLYMAHMGYHQGTQFQRALKELASEFLGDSIPVERPAWGQSAAERIHQKATKLGTAPRADMLELGPKVADWKYRDLHGNIIASVARYEPEGRDKTYRPFCYKIVDGQQAWRMGAPELRPLYRLPEIALASHVVLVEGEKCADALASLGIDATTAMQGAHAPVDKTDWSPLQRKTVVIWPDNDEPGRDYANRAAARLKALGCSVLIVSPPAGKPKGWDAADCVAEGGDPRDLLRAASEASPPSRIRILDIDDLENVQPPSFLIDGILTEQGLSVLWGRSGDLKSFVGVDISLCVATGCSWHGRAVKVGLVVYVAAEGSFGLAARAVGWRRTRGSDLPKPKFKLIPQSIALVGEDLQPTIDAVLALEEPPTLIVIDTMARTFGAGDENKQADMNAYVSAADKLREATGAHVMVIHHSGVHEDKRERGSNVLRGAADTIIKVKRTDQKLQLINKAPEGKQKDAEEFETVHLRIQKVAYQANGSERSTLILNLDDNPTTIETEPTEPKLGPVQQAIVDALREAGRPLGRTSLISITKAHRSSINSAIEKLIEMELIVEVGDVESPHWELIPEG